jgi:hypothetical protein
MKSSCIVGHISEVCPCKEHILQTFTSFTLLFEKSSWVPNCFELVAMFKINWHAALGVLSTNAPQLTASMILRSIGINPS